MAAAPRWVLKNVYGPKLPAKLQSLPMVRKASFGCSRYPYRRSLKAENEVSSPIRCAGPAAGVMSGPGNGLHGSQCGNEHPRARLLPHDEEPVWPNGDAGVAWLLPEESAERSR